MKRIPFFFLLFSVLCFGCTKDEPSDLNYPTVVKALTKQEINLLLGQLAETPLSNCTAIDTFGYFFPILEEKFCIDTAWRSNYSIVDLELIAKETVTEYGTFMGMPDSSLFRVRSIVNEKGIAYQNFKETYPDSFPLVWIITSKPQIYNNLEVRGTNLKIVVSQYGTVSVGGNWYKSIYIPEIEEFDEDSAKNSLLTSILEYKSSKITIRETTTWQKSQKIIIPIIRSNKKELRVCWALYPESWEVLIDSETGEKISAINIDKI